MPTPSWGHAPDELRWRDLSWKDRGRVVAIILTLVLVGLAGSLR